MSETEMSETETETETETEEETYRLTQTSISTAGGPGLRFEPTSYKRAMTCTESEEWHGAITSEILSVIKNGTFQPILVSRNTRSINTKWVFKIKELSDGKIDKYKARLVALGFLQQLGINYMDTYSPIAKMVTIRIAFSFAAHHDLIIKHYDIKTAFLHGEIEEDIYINIPEGWETIINELKATMNTELEHQLPPPVS